MNAATCGHRGEKDLGNANVENHMPTFPQFCEQPVSITTIIVLRDLKARKFPKEMHTILAICSESLCPFFCQGLAFHRRTNDYLVPYFHPQPSPMARKNHLVYHLLSFRYFPWVVNPVNSDPLRCSTVAPGLPLLGQLAPQVRHVRSPDANLHAKPLQGGTLGQGLSQVDAIGRAHHFLNSARIFSWDFDGFWEFLATRKSERLKKSKA